MDYGFKTTTRGREVLAACMALKKPPDICRVAFGGGKISETANLADQHELLEYVAEGTIGNRSHKGNHLCFTIQYANSEHPDVKTFYLSEFIVYIKDPETGEDADLLYGTLGDYRQPVPQHDQGMPPCVWNLPLVLVLSDELEVKISAPPGLVTYEDLLEAVDRLTLGIMTNELTLPLATGTGEDLLTDAGTPILAVYHPNQCGSVMAALNALEGRLAGQITQTAANVAAYAGSVGRQALAGATTYMDAALAAHDASAEAHPAQISIVEKL